jgi:hypothetical protein
LLGVTNRRCFPKAHLDAGKPSDHNLEEVLKQTFASVDAELTEHEFVVHALSLPPLCVCVYVVRACVSCACVVALIVKS